MFTLIDTEEITEETCYLNHAYLGSMSCGSEDMAWTTKSELEAEGMQARAAVKGKTLFIHQL